MPSVVKSGRASLRRKTPCRCMARALARTEHQGDGPMIPNDFPALNFDLGETADQLRASVRGFTADEIAPIASEIDRTNEFPRQLWPKLGALGLHGITVEEEYGGAGGGELEDCVAGGGSSRGPAPAGASCCR